MKTLNKIRLLCAAVMMCCTLISASPSSAETVTYDFESNFTGDDLITLDNMFWNNGTIAGNNNSRSSINFTQSVDVVQFNLASTLSGWYNAYGSISINAYNDNYTEPIYTQTLTINNSNYYPGQLIAIDTVNKVDSLEFIASGTNVYPTVDNLVIDTSPASFPALPGVEITYDTIYPASIDPYYVPVSIKKLPFDGILWDVEMKWNKTFLEVYRRDGSGYPITPKFMGTGYWDYDARNVALGAVEALKEALIADGYTGNGVTGSYMITPWWWSYGTAFEAADLRILTANYSNNLYPNSGFTLWTPSAANWSVVSSAGTTVKAADNSLTLKFSLGQPTPVSVPLTPNPLDNTELRPGFWGKTAPGCKSSFDFDTDGDVDGSDLVSFSIALAANTELAQKNEQLAASFGVIGCP